MIRPFGLHDIGLVRKLQRCGMPLGIEQQLTHPRQPLWTALTAPWPWAGAGTATYVLDEAVGTQQLAGFVQLTKRLARPEADLLHLAPAFLLAQGGGADAIWERLLNHCAQAAASHGLQRVFASTPENCPEQIAVSNARFSCYTRETIFRLASAPPACAAAPGYRAQEPEDSWALQRLYARSVPRLVQAAEGAVTGQAGSPTFSWWEPDCWRGLVWEPAGEVRGAAQVHLGRTGHWLRIWSSGDLSGRELRSLVEQTLRLIALADVRSMRRVLPVYVVVRDYEAGVASVLTGFGFAAFANRLRFVRHTAAVVRAPVLTSLATAEARQELAVHSLAQLDLEPHVR